MRGANQPAAAGPAAGEWAGRYAAVLLDMDGTLIDSDGAVERSWARWAKAYGVDPDAVIAVCHGATPRGLASRFRPDLDEAGLTESDRFLAELEYDDTAGVVACAGAAELVETLDGCAIAWAVVTNADRKLAGIRLAAGGIEPPLLVGLDDVADGKPDPAGYLLAADRLGVDARQCLAVEDSPAGVTAGRAAGAVVAGVKGVEADHAVSDLAQLAAALR